jgi:hypothetical protein
VRARGRDAEQAKNEQKTNSHAAQPL